jgi:hypothetical protein
LETAIVAIRPVPRGYAAAEFTVRTAAENRPVEALSRPWKPPDRYGYSWLLGFYLGDGCVATTKGSYQLRVVLDGRYHGVIDECVT